MVYVYVFFPDPDVNVTLTHTRHDSVRIPCASLSLSQSRCWKLSIYKLEVQSLCLHPTSCHGVIISIQPLTLTQDTGSVSVSISSQLDQTILCLKITVAVACAERLSIHMRWKWLTFHTMPLCQYFYLALDLDPDPGSSLAGNVLICYVFPSLHLQTCRVGDMSVTCRRSCRRHGDIACRLECLNDTTFDDMSGIPDISVISWLLFQPKHKNSMVAMGLSGVWSEWHAYDP